MTFKFWMANKRAGAENDSPNNEAAFSNELGSFTSIVGCCAFLLLLFLCLLLPPPLPFSLSMIDQWLCESFTFALFHWRWAIFTIYWQMTNWFLMNNFPIDSNDNLKIVCCECFFCVAFFVFTFFCSFFVSLVAVVVITTPFFDVEYKTHISICHFSTHFSLFHKLKKTQNLKKKSYKIHFVCRIQWIHVEGVWRANTLLRSSLCGDKIDGGKCV